MYHKMLFYDNLLLSETYLEDSCKARGTFKETPLRQANEMEYAHTFDPSFMVNNGQFRQS